MQKELFRLPPARRRSRVYSIINGHLPALLGVHRAFLPRYPILVLLLALALAACDGSGGDDNGLIIDDSPEATLRAIAGLDQDVNEGEEVILSGSSEVSDANLSLSYSWEQISGSPVELFGADSQVASFSTTVDADTNLSFRLLVQSQSGLEATDDLLVSVNNAPTAIIEGVSSVAEGVGVTLNGWQSLDSEDGSIVAYDWLQVAGANVALYYEDQATVSFAAPSIAVDENLSFELVVTDDDGAVGRSTAIVEVLDDSDNPSIAAVYLSPGIYGISDNMIITLEAVDAENGLSLQEGSNLNGQELTDFAPISGQDGNYTAIYTVADNNPSQDDGASVSANIVLVDPAGNASAAITEIQLDGVSIDTLPPSVNNITVGAGAHAIGAEVEITIAAVSTETNLSLRAGSTFNGQELTDFAAVDGLGGYYTAIYTVTSGDPDLSASADANISIVVLDLAGNESPEYTIATLGDSASVDANPPAVSSVDVSSGAYGIGDDIRISIIPVDVETDLTISPNANSFNGRALSEFVHIDSGVYSAVYTVTEGDGDVADNTSADINIALVDAYGNVGGALTSTLLSNSSIDSTRPQLSVLSISDGVYRIGSKLAIYLRATEDEVGLQLQDSTFNGSRLTGFSDLQNGFYALTYTVAAGDSDRADGAEVDTNITLADPFGNDSLTITTVTLDGESIDANAPVIESISVGEGIYLIGDELMLYISADDSDLILKPGSSFNGQELSDFQPIAGQDGNYSAIYTVVEDDPSVDVGDSAVSNIALLDAAGNESETISSVNIGIKTSIGAKVINITDISASEGFYVIGDSMILTITTLGEDPDLVLKDGSSFNGQPLTNFTPVAGADGVYQATYIVADGNPDIAAGGEVSIDIILADTAGNESERSTSLTLAANTSIDANSPIIDSVSVAGGNHGIGAVVEIILSTSGDETDFTLAEGSTFNGQELTGFSSVDGEDGDYVVTYTVVEGDNYVADGSSAVAYIALVDASTNLGAPTQLVPLVDAAIDADRPEISAISAADGEFAIGYDIALTLTVVDSDTELTLSSSGFNGGTVNGLSRSGDGIYNTTYTVSEGDADIAIGDEFITDIALVDSAGNVGASFQSLTSLSTSVDANSPIVASIVVEPGVYKIGDNVSFTITASNNEAGLILTSSDTFNGDSRWSVVDTGDGNYSGVYKVEEGDPDVAAGGTVGVDISFTDSAGNDGPRFTAVDLDPDTSIDANSPGVASISVAAGSYGIGDVAVLTITASNNETGLSLDNGSTFNDEQLTDIVDKLDGNYSANYTVVEGNRYVAEGAPITINIFFTDPSGNISPAQQSITPSGVSIEAERPTIETVSVAQGVYKVGDEVTLTIVAGDDENDLSLKSGSSFNGSELHSFRADDDLNGVYTAIYTPSFDDDGITAGATVSADIALVDTFGNASAAVTELELDDTSVDTTPPSIYDVLVDGDNVINGADDLTVIFVEGSTSGVENQYQATLNVGGVETLALINSDGDIGSFNTTVDLSELPDGTHTIIVEAADAAGNPARSESEFIIDTEAPIVEQLLIAGDNKINAAEAALELLPVEGTIAGAEEGQIISLTIDEVAAEASVDSVGDFMVDVDLSSLSADGSYIVTATVSDIAGNSRDYFSTFEKDTVIPTIDSVTVADDDVINLAEANAVEINGTTTGVEDDQVVSIVIFAGLEASKDTKANVTDNKFNATFYLTDFDDSSSINLIADVSDAAGNPAKQFAKINIVKDTIAPSISSISLDTGAHKVGTTVGITITAYADESGLTFASTIFNGQNLDEITDHNNGTYTSSYTVVEGDPDVAAGGAVAVDLAFTSDAAGNAGIDITYVDLGDDTSIDANSPSIADISVAEGAHIVGATVELNITASNNEPGLTLSSKTFNGKELGAVTDNGDGNYTTSYTVEEGDNDIAAGGIVDVNLAFSDSSNNTGTAITSVSLASGTSIDANSPSIADISVAAGTHKVGSVVELNITATNNEPGLTLSSKTFNGQELGDVIDNGDGNYTTRYTVEEGDNDIAAGGSVDVNLAFSDSSDNTGTAITSVTLASGTSIDANSPTIANVSVAEGIHKVGSVVELNITASNNEPGLTLSSKTFNGKELGAVIDNGDGNYTASYTVEEGDNDIVAGGSVDVNLAFSDSSNNTGTATTSVSLTSGTSIDANSPSIDSVSVEAGTHKVGDEVEVVITETNNETGLTLSSNTFNGEALAVGAASDGIYTFTYTVIETNTDVVDGGDVTVNLAFSDSSGNTGTATTSVSLTSSTSIDANSPQQTIDTIAISDDTGTWDYDFLTNKPNQNITATLSAALGNDEFLFGSVSSNSEGDPIWDNITDKVSDRDISWSTTLSSGSNDIQLKVMDTAGNDGDVATQPYTLDTTPPEINTSDTDTEVDEASPATLNANASNDSNGIASYAWAQVESDGTDLQDSTALTIDDTTTASTTVSTPGITDDDGADLSFYFAVTITDIAGNVATSLPLTLSVSNTYKTPTITAIASAPNFDQLSISWQTDTGLTYNLHRSTSSTCDLSDTTNCANYFEYASVNLSSGAQIDTGLDFFTPYYYWLETHFGSTLVALSSTPTEANTTGPALNDTGVIQGGDYPSGFDTLGGGVCNGGYLVDDNGDVIADPDNHSGNSTFIAFDNEDCELGRDADATLNDDGDGNAGFSLTRLNSDGSEYSGSGDYGTDPWSCVLDNVTGLIWEVKTNDNTLRDRDEGFTWYNSSTADGTPSDQDTGDFVDYVNGNAEVNSGNGLCGQTNWRLPTVQELVGISDFSTYEPVVDTSYFPNSRTGAYEWSWTADLNSDTENLSNFAWLYNYYIGSIRSGGNSLGATSNSFYVRLVSSSEAVKSYFNDYSSDGGRYTDHEDGTVSDNRTGLMWMKCIYGQAHNLSDNSCGGTGAGAGGTWQEAFAKAAAINEGVGTFGYTDWRLPNMKELLSLVDLSSFQPPINQAIFPNTDGQSQWTSTLSAQDGGDAALAVGLGADPEFGLLGKTTTTTRVRLVRDDVNTPRILTLEINGDNVINSEDDLANIPISGSTSDVEDGQQITLVIDTTTFYVAVSSDTVNDTIDLSTISDGTALAVTADVSDQAGKEANQFTTTLIKDTTIPSISEVTVAEDNTINFAEANSVTITGSTDDVEDEQTISITINDNNDPAVKITATTTVTNNTFTITNLNLSDLADGTNLSLTADVADAVGNDAPTYTSTITKDTDAPSIAITSVATDNTINASEVGIAEIIGTTSGAENDQTVSLSITDGITTVDTTATISNNSYSATADLTSLAESTSTTSLTLNATVADAAGNESSTNKTNIIKDTKPPSILSVLVAGDNLVNSSELGNSVAVSGTTSGVEDGQQISLSILSHIPTATVTNDSFTTTVNLSGLSDRTVSVTANVADAAGNQADTFTGSFVIDITAPTQAVNSLTINLSADTGTYSSDFLTNQANQTIRAELNATLGDGDVLYASVNDGATWQQVDSANISGTSIAWPTTLLNGTSSIQFQVADAADNNGTLIEKDYTLDITPPEQTISGIALTPDTGVLSDDFITTTNGPDPHTITATLSPALDTGDVLWGAISLNSAGDPDWIDITGSVTSQAITWETDLSTGENDIQLKVEDAAGNSGQIAEQNYTFDNLPPTIDITGTTSNAEEASDATLDAANSSDNYDIASYEWTQVQSDNSALSDDDIQLTIANANDATTTVSTPGITDDTVANMSFYFSLRITDVAGNGAGIKVTLIVDNTHTTPTITANPVGAPDFNQISLSWSADTSLNYSIYRSTQDDCDLSNYTTCTNPALYTDSTGITISDTSIASVTDTDSSDSFQLFNSYYYWLGAQIGTQVVSLSSTPIEATNSGPVLNDTGITGGGDYPSGFDNHNGLSNTCDGGYIDSNDDDGDGDTTDFIAFDDEDCELGRDATNNDDSDGNAGFVFTKLDIDGTELPADADAWSCVLDHTTGLIWEVKTTDGTWRDAGAAFTWYNPNHGQDYDKDGNAITFYGTESSQDTQDFIDYINSDSSINNGSGLCGHTNWRLPTVHEIKGLADYDAVAANGLGGYSSPSIDTDYFPHALASQYNWYWTSHLNVDPDVNPGGDGTVAGSSTSNYYAWAYNSAESRTRSGTGSTVGSTVRSNYVRLVSSSAAVASHFSDYSDDRYTDNGDGTISDARTGLMWMQCSYGQTYDGGDTNSDGIICEGSPTFGSWQQAFAWAADSNANVDYGYNYWRLPNIKELGSIVDFGSAIPAINQSIFPNTSTGSYWTSTPSKALDVDSNDDTQSASIWFHTGDHGLNKRTANLYLRLVRDDIKTPRILTVNISDDNIIGSLDDFANISVSGTTNDVEADQKITLVINTTTVYADIQADGSFTTTIDLSGIADGTYSVIADVSDINAKAANQFTGSLLVDTAAPTIASVSATAGTYGIGDPVPLSITATDGETGLTLSSNSFNDQSLGEVTDNGDGTYTTSYTVIENDPDIADGDTVEVNLAFTDPAGNPGAATESITLSGASIDAHRPTIASVGVEAGNHGIGASVAITITATDAETGLTLSSATFNGATLGSVNDKGDGTYNATYTVEEDNAHVADGGAVSVDLAFTDPAGNAGTAFESVTLPTGTSIDATAPTQTISTIKLSDDSGALNDDYLTNNPTQTITATLSTGLESGDTLHGSVDSGVIWTDTTTSLSGTIINWATTLTSGEIQFKVVDAAGNDGAVAKQAYTLDTTDPTINTSGTDSTADEGSSASLDASNSSDSNGIASYSWTQVASDGNALADSSTALAITNAESATASVIAPGIIADTDPDLSLYFAVTVTDEAGNDATSSPLTLTVTNAYKTPTITASTNASFDQISLSWDADNSLDYYLYRSTDSNCDLSNYNNACNNSALYTDNTGITISGTTASISDTDVIADTIYYYWLEAQLDSEVVSLNTDPIQVATTPPPGVNAGIANSQAIGTLASLRGSATADPGKTIASYLWEETTSHGITIDRADTANASFTVPDNLVVGDVLSFQLTAIDSDGARTSATTSITIAKPGSQKWYFGVGDGYGVKSSPAIGADGTVYFGAEDKNLYALNPQNGSLKWSFPTGGAIKTPPAIDANGTVYFASDDENLYAVSAPTDGSQSGVQEWSRSVGTIYSAHTSVSIAADGTLYYVSSDKSFYALNPADGNALWSSGHSGDVSMTKPAISPSGTIYFASGGEDGTIFAIDPSSGVGDSRDFIWEFKTSSYLTDTSPAIGDDGSVYNGGWNNDKLYALDSNGNEKWDYGPGGDVQTSPAIAADGTIYFGSRGKSLYALDSNADGDKKKWSYRTGGNVDSSPVIGADGTVYVGSDDFNVYAFDPADIDPDNVAHKWSIPTNGKVSFSSSALAPDGTLFIGSADGLYAIHTASAGLQAASPWPKFGQNNRNSGRVNLPPTANAGDDQTVSAGAIVTLDASASTDTDGNIIDYYWRETSSYGISITNNNSAQASFTAPNYGNGPITIELTVTDDHGATHTTTHTITIN